MPSEGEEVIPCKFSADYNESNCDYNFAEI